mmetsp:Transcript_13862/g.21127  ORF Transcript_13862/g.21127 Transcript_13862/m.21127 type:complete len:148 (+) Transcript_13862:1-444(+)|eukprot:CAMPEP_0178915726 /NCGR_PEP_ID=MMETSP0786-20121207/12196_1 /TAXON_ID=186022 /ORGANISM="Thalassionema frauenfeldii, Strain CCMP 1798" /LENGTH=147 /DNA_ID=CAMNT_0020588887 /DNA_START=18 /DNA_END=461 /DNA_ORIENTATION=+
MAGSERPIERPSWLKGVILPTVAGCGLSMLMPGSMAPYYTFAGWQGICGASAILEMAKKYKVSSMPQASRVIELLGVFWMGVGCLTAVADPIKDQSTLLVACVCNQAFTILAGPLRLMDANKNEKVIIPLTSFLVGWAASSTFLKKK